MKCLIMAAGYATRLDPLTEKSPNPEPHWCCLPFCYYTREDARLVAKGIEAGCGTDAPRQLYCLAVYPDPSVCHGSARQSLRHR